MSHLDTTNDFFVFDSVDYELNSHDGDPELLSLLPKLLIGYVGV
jgi:hypothetical protein